MRAEEGEPGNEASPLLGYMIFCQFYVWGTEVYTFILLNSDKALTLLGFTSLTLCDFWNLNFFTLLIPPFCISKVITTAHLELLDLYSYSPIYLLMLFVFTCIIIEHYPHKTIIQKLWKPFNILISKINHKQVGKDSVVHAFATVINPRRACARGYGSRRVCLSVCLSVCPSVRLFPL